MRFLLLLFIQISPLFATYSSFQAKTVSFSDYTAQGVKYWDLFAQSAHLGKQKQLFHLKSVRAILYADLNNTLFFQSPKALYNQKDKKISFKDTVTIRHSNGIHGSSKEALCDLARKTVLMSKDVLVENSNVSIKSDQMLFHIKSGDAIFRKNLSCQFVNTLWNNNRIDVRCRDKIIVNSQKGLIRFFDFVQMTCPYWRASADRMDLFFTREDYSVKQDIYLKDNVQIFWHEMKAISGLAKYNLEQRTLTLEESPKIFNKENVITADKMVFFAKDQKIHCFPSARMIVRSSDENKKLLTM